MQGPLSPALHPALLPPGTQVAPTAAYSSPHSAQASLLFPKALHPDHVAPPLGALILRMLSVHPEGRGTAAQLAEELESAAASLAASHVP